MKDTPFVRFEFSHKPVVEDWVVVGELHVQRRPNDAKGCQMYRIAIT